MRIVWHRDEIKKLVEMAVSGKRWPAIAKTFGKTAPACQQAFQRYASEEQAQARVRAIGMVYRTDRVSEGALRSPEHEPFAANAFRDVRSRDFGRAPMACDPRYSLTPTSIA